MTVVALALGYAGVGVVVAALALAVRRASPLDAVLLLGLWPLYAPVLAAGRATAEPGDEPALRAVLRMVAAAPPGRGLPSIAPAADLIRRVGAARQRVRALDRALDRPAFDVAAARARVDGVDVGGPPGAVVAARRQLAAIERLRGARDRGAAALAEVDLVVAQLATQLEVAHLTGAADAEATELCAELIAHVDALDDPVGNDAGDPGVVAP